MYLNLLRSLLIASFLIASVSLTLSAETYYNRLDCLTKVIYNESRGEPYVGKLAIAFVVENRSKSEDFPDKYCEVVKQPNQFAYRKKASKASEDWKNSRRVASHFLTVKPFMEDPTNGATYFLKKGTSKPKWMKGGKKVKKTVVISRHVFFKRKKN